MDALERLAEERIREAIERGELDGLAGAGHPLALDDDSLVAPELRVAYRVLRNAGFVPEEVRLRRELHALESLLDDSAGAHDAGEDRSRALRRLDLLRSRLAARPGGERTLALRDGYRSRVLERLAGGQARAAQDCEPESPPGG